MSTSVGQQLREARQARNRSLEQVSRVTHIKPQHLEALEAGNLDALPSRTQARGFLRTYALHLGLDPDPLIDRLGSDLAETPAPPPPRRLAVDDLVRDLFYEIGEDLRLQRETLGVSLDEAEKQTRLRRHYLDALERGEMHLLPSPVQGRGMLKNYADFLGMDSDPLLTKLAEGIQAQHADRRAGRMEEAGPPRRSRLRRMVSGDLLFGGLFLFGLIIFIIWAVGRVSLLQTSQALEPTAPAIVDVLDPLPTATLTPTVEPTVDPLATAAPAGDPGPAEAATAVPTQPITNNAPVQVYIVVVERTWMRVTVDGAVEFEGRVIPGSAFPFSGREQIQVLAASGSALEIFHNQNDLGPMGLFGQIVERIYTASAVLLPTPAVSPTPTATETAETTATPEASPSPAP